MTTNKHQEIAEKNITRASEWIIGGYINDIEDGYPEYLPKSMEDLIDEIYESAIENKYTGSGEWIGRAPKEMRFAGTEFCRDLIIKICTTDEDVQTIAEEAGWNAE